MAPPALRCALLVLLSGIAIPGAARAEPIVVRSGHLAFGDDDPEFFVLRGDGLLLEGGTEAVETRMSRTRSPYPAPVGPAVVEMTTEFGGALGGSLGKAVTATIGGVTFLEDAFALRGTFLFDAPAVTVPPGAIYTVTAPFRFRGAVAGFPWERPGVGPPIFEAELSGRGTVRLDPEGVLLTFHSPAPIPEPGTIVLLATGMAGVWLRQRRRVSTARASKEVSYVSKKATRDPKEAQPLPRAHDWCGSHARPPGGAAHSQDARSAADHGSAD